MAKRTLKTGFRHLAVLLGIGVICMPVTFIVTLLLMPLWSWTEATYGIESVGHSGPADWCYWVVYVLMVALGVGAYVVVVKAERTQN